MNYSSELEVYKIIKNNTKLLREERKVVRIGYRKLKIDDEWFFWRPNTQAFEKARERAASAAPATSRQPQTKN